MTTKISPYSRLSFALDSETVLYKVLVDLDKLLLPILPHTAEEIFEYLEHEKAITMLHDGPPYMPMEISTSDTQMNKISNDNYRSLQVTEWFHTICPWLILYGLPIE